MSVTPDTVQLTYEARITSLNLPSNFTTHVNSFQDGPIILVEGEVPTKAYYSTTTIGDFRCLATDLHNLKRFSQDHQTKLTYQEQRQFISSTNTMNTSVYTSNEYYHRRTTLPFNQCTLTCSSLQARIPANVNEVEEGAKLLKLGLSFFWVHTVQDNQIKKGGDWEKLYTYQLFWMGNYQL